LKKNFLVEDGLSMSDKKYSRIDIIGQNGNEGLHYNYPTKVCFDCGMQAMGASEMINDTYQWNEGECQVCGLRGDLVTSPFFFGCPEFPNNEEEK